MKCGHSFCSLCIRRHCDATLNRTTSEQCPCCREKIDLQQDLRKNVSLGALVDKFKVLSKDLLAALFQSSASCEPASSKKRVRMVTPGKAITARLAQYHFHGASKEVVRKAMEEVTRDSKVKLRAEGSKEAMERRLRELIHLINAQLGADCPLSLEEAVEAINYQDKLADAEALKARRTSSSSSSSAAASSAEQGFRALTQKALAAKQQANPAPVTPSPAPLRQHQQQQVYEQRGPWRIAISAALQRPFYFNTETELGQFSLPADLAALMAEDDEQDHLRHSPSPAHDQDHEHEQAEEHDYEHEQPLGEEEDSEEQRVYTQFSLLSQPAVQSEDAPLAGPQEPLLLLSDTPSSSSLPPPSSSSTSSTSSSSSAHIVIEEEEEEVLLPPPSAAAQEVQTQLDPAGLSQLSAAQWVCLTCTYINSSRRRPKCEMCEAANPAHVTVPYSKPSRSLRGPANYNESALVKASLSQSTLTYSSSNSSQKHKKQRKV